MKTIPDSAYTLKCMSLPIRDLSSKEVLFICHLNTMQPSEYSDMQKQMIEDLCVKVAQLEQIRSA